MMKDKALLRLIQGYKQFIQEYKSDKYDDYRKEAMVRQKPEVLLISCSDARVNPSLVTRTKLGEIFLVSNVANIVPPYEPDNLTHHSTSSALEFAVGTLEVKNIIVMGHSNCGGIQALIDGPPVALDGEYSFITPWVEIIAAARDNVQHLPKEEQYHACELEALKISLANLKTFPWINERIAKGTLSIHVWHFDIPTGVITMFNEATDSFSPLAGSATHT